MEDPSDRLVESRIGIEDSVCPLLNTSESEEWDLKEVHRNIELQHERSKYDVRIVEHHYEEDPVEIGVD